MQRTNDPNDTRCGAFKAEWLKSSGHQGCLRPGLHHLSSLLILMGHLQEAGLLQNIADQLHTDRKTTGIKATGHADRRQTGEIGRNGEQIRQIHGQGIVRMGTVPEGCAG